MNRLKRQLQNKRDKLNNRLGVVRSLKAVRSIQRELDSVDEYLRILRQ
jgi:hypothetical protein